MIDEIHSGVGVVAESDFLVHKDFGGEGAQDFCLLVLRRVGLGGIRGTAERVVFRRAPAARLEGCGESGDGEGEDGEEGCEIHFEWIAGGDRIGVGVRSLLKMGVR